MYCITLNKPDAVNEWRNLIGATNPAEASEGAIRKDFASSLSENAVHGLIAMKMLAEKLVFL